MLTGPATGRDRAVSNGWVTYTVCPKESHTLFLKFLLLWQQELKNTKLSKNVEKSVLSLHKKVDILCTWGLLLSVPLNCNCVRCNDQCAAFVCASWTNVCPAPFINWVSQTPILTAIYWTKTQQEQQKFMKQYMTFSRAERKSYTVS